MAVSPSHELWKKQVSVLSPAQHCWRHLFNILACTTLQVDWSLQKFSKDAFVQFKWYEQLPPEKSPYLKYAEWTLGTQFMHSPNSILLERHPRYFTTLEEQAHIYLAEVKRTAWIKPKKSFNSFERKLVKTVHNWRQPVTLWQQAQIHVHLKISYMGGEEKRVRIPQISELKSCFS